MTLTALELQATFSVIFDDRPLSCRDRSVSGTFFWTVCRPLREPSATQALTGIPSTAPRS